MADKEQDKPAAKARKAYPADHFDGDADPKSAADHQRAHDEGTEDAFHAKAKAAEQAEETGDRVPTPEVVTEGKLAETVPDTTAPSADELRAMGREVKPQVEPTDVPTDRYPDKVELVDGKPLTVDHEGKRAPRALYTAAKQGPMRLSKAEYEAMLATDGGLEDWERADARAMHRKGDLKFHDKEI